MRRTPLLLATAVASSALLLAGCSSTGTATADTATSVSVQSVPVQPAAATEDAPVLADGLLPAVEFAPGADVQPVTVDQLAQALAQGPRHDPGAVTITPQTCVVALDAARNALGDPASLQDAAGQVARSGFAASAELLTVGPSDTVVGTLVDAVAACPTATLSSPMGEATVTFGELGSPELGDTAVVVPVTVTATRGEGGSMTGSALLGVVQDGDRLLTLVSGAVAGAPDAQAFDDLLAAAVQHAGDTLG